jgi:hypothetical protein
MMMKSEKKGCIVTMLMALLALSCTSEDTLSSTNSDSVPVSLVMNVSTNRASTRMSAEMTQQTGYRGIQDQRLFPFSSDALVNNLISSGKQPLTTYITNLNKYNEETDNLHYFDDRSVKVPNGTAAFLCYCRAIPSSSGSKFENGSLISNIIKVDVDDELDWSTSSTSDIKFEPEKIYTAVANNVVTVPAAATTIADYLNSIANAHPDGQNDNTWSVFSQTEAEQFQPLASLKLRSLFREFVNDGHPIACSSEYVVQWVNQLETKLNALDLSDDASNIQVAVQKAIDAVQTAMTGATAYPASIHLPDGVAVVKWNYATKVFESQVQTNTDVNNINSLNRFVYPAELFYYANSRIKTSKSSRKQDYSKKSWDAVLDTYDAGYGEMDFSVHSVAIIDPLSYAVGCLQVGLNVQSTLQDAAGKTITLEDGTTENKDASFPLKAILISSQFAQGYDFTPKGEVDEYIIYDPTIEGNISMGGSIVPTPTTPSQYTNTLVLQTKDNENVRFALEFENNSGEDFEGINGKVFKGTKFYLVGTIKVPAVVDQDKDFKKRVFTKNHITQGTVTISSLKDAYTYLPDLLDPRLEVGIQLVPNWIQVTTTNVPL